jgi:protein MpaA
MSSIIRKILLTGAYTLITVFLFGCAELTRTVDNILHLRPSNIYAAGRSVQGRPIEYSVHGTGELTVFILGAIHGDEPASAVLVTSLQEYLSENPQLVVLTYRRVVVLPVANPDGFAAGTRGNANGVDLNRNFPAANRINSASFGLKALSEPESNAILKLIDKYKPIRIVSVHQPLGCVDYDGPAAELAGAVAAASELPLRKVGAMPGSLGSFAGEMMNIPIITLELPSGTEDFNELMLQKFYKPALLSAIEYPR